MRLDCVTFGIALVLSSPSVLRAQGRSDYFNVESPQVKPITVARLGGHDYILACNTPDNSLEIWDTNESLPNRFKGRVRVGLEPVSVRYRPDALDPTRGRAYTADFLGDSITVVALSAQAGTVTAELVMTHDVGDEPMDIAFSQDGLSVFVTHNTFGSLSWRSTATLEPVSSIPPFTDMSRIDLVVGSSPGLGLKEPRTVAVSGNKLFALGFKGGNKPAYDFDVFVLDLPTLTASPIAGLGSTNFNMTFAGNGDLWVVGGEAQNKVGSTEATVANELTGFVKSTIYLVPGGTGAAVRRDLNDLNTNGMITPVSQNQALAQPTDVVTYEPAGGPLRVFIAAFGSDRIGVLTPSTNPDPYTWTLARINVTHALGSGNRQAGPRGLAIKYAITGDSSDPGDRLYVMNRLDNSISTIDPATNAFLGTFVLNRDPTPVYIRDGRLFLYSAKFSGNKFVSCASCHMDGRTDSLGWDLSNNTLVDYPDKNADGLTPNDPNFQANKGLMVTQSLQGLLNYEVDPAIQENFTNSPYHWRADKEAFVDFNPAFVNLLHSADVGGGDGLVPEDMETFRTFVNSINYPPNPYEPDVRRFGGSLGAGQDGTTGSGALLGLKLFHTFPFPATCQGRSCVQCHWLPEGSNNRGTDGNGTAPDPPGDVIETAALRGLFQRESRLDKTAADSPFGGPSTPHTAEFGLAHAGGRDSLNTFINLFIGQLPDPGLQAIKAFARQFDWGVAPLVGSAYTVDPTSNVSTTKRTLDIFELQARQANVGIAVHASIGGQEQGYWLDLTQAPAPTLQFWYQRENLSGSLTRAQLLALVALPKDRLVFIATPLGSERRVASVNGTIPVLTGAPSSVGLELLPAVTNTAYASVPTLTKNWDPNDAVPANRFVVTPNDPTPVSVKAIRLMQHGLIRDGGVGTYGLSSLRHEAPRRFAVAGFGIRQGAILHLFVDDSATMPNHNGPLTADTIEFALPIYPTEQTLGDGRRVWQTAVEVDARVLYTLLLGGELAPGMQAVLDPLQVPNLGDAQEHLPLGTFKPNEFNWHYVKVENPDPAASQADGGWQQLKMAP